jgi:hypothetical protein
MCLCWAFRTRLKEAGSRWKSSSNSWPVGPSTCCFLVLNYESGYAVVVYICQCVLFFKKKIYIYNYMCIIISHHKLHQISLNPHVFCWRISGLVISSHSRSPLRPGLLDPAASPCDVSWIFPGLGVGWRFPEDLYQQQMGRWGNGWWDGWIDIDRLIER